MLEVVILGQLAGVKCAAQCFIRRVLDKALSQSQQGIGNALAQAVSYAGTLLLTGCAPFLPDALGRIASRATGVQQAPDVGELSITLTTQ